LFKEFYDVFSWTYYYLKDYVKYIFQDILPLKERENLARKKMRIVNPKLKPLIKIELQNLKKVGIIFPIRHSEWISNPVIVRKKSGEIILCVEFRDMNKESIKDNYPLPNMIGLALMSMLDGFSGYNQVLVKKEGQLKTSFTTPWRISCI
jgi:hypothetical protein